MGCQLKCRMCSEFCSVSDEMYKSRPRGFVCGVCQVEVAVKKKAKCQKTVNTFEGQTDLGIPPKYHGAEFKDCEHTKALQAWYNNGGMITLQGTTGNGKTRMLYACLRTAYEDMKDKPIFYSVPMLCVKLQGMCKVMGDMEEFIKELCETDTILLLDDLGAEKTTDFVKQTLYIILSEREKWDRPTMITTNYLLSEIAEMFDARIASRLKGGTVLEFTGKDWRISNANRNTVGD